MKIGIPVFPRALNPLYVTDEVSTELANKIYDGLYCFDANGHARSRLIALESVQATPIQMKIELQLKRSIFFSNGKQFTADDILQTYQLIKDERFLSPYRPYIQGIRKIKKISPFQVRIIFNPPIANWKNHLVFKILNHHELKSVSPGTFRDQIFSGTGPLEFKHIYRPRQIILAPNRYNHLKKIPRYREIHYDVIAYSHHHLFKLQKGEVDIIDIEPELMASCQREPKLKRQFTVVPYQKFGYTYLVFNLTRKRITLNIRKAFFNFLHTGNFMQRFLKKRGVAVKTPFLLLNQRIPVPRYDQPPVIQPLKSQVRLRILCNRGSQIRSTFIQFLAKGIRKYRIELVPEFVEHQLMLDRLRKKDFDIAISGFLLDLDFDLSDVLASKGYFNYAGYRSEKMDQLLKTGLLKQDRTEREMIYLDAHHQWQKDLPILPLFNLYYHKGISKRILIPKHLPVMIDSSGDFLQDFDRWLYKSGNDINLSTNKNEPR